MVNENDIVLCTVESVDGTTVFVKLEDGSQGTIVFSEIAPGRIRNIREYVSPNKKIVCRVMRISQNHIDLSLRRVTGKERDEVMNIYKQELTARTALKSLLKEEAETAISKILEDFKTLSEFLNSAREDEKILTKYIPKSAIEQIKKILQKKKKEIEVVKIIKIKCLSENGLKRVKEVFETSDSSITITYLAAGNYQINIKDEDYKKANQKMNEFVENIEKKSKKDFCDFSVEDKK